MMVTQVVSNYVANGHNYRYNIAAMYVPIMVFQSPSYPYTTNYLFLTLMSLAKNTVHFLHIKFAVFGFRNAQLW